MTVREEDSVHERQKGERERTARREQPWELLGGRDRWVWRKLQTERTGDGAPPLALCIACDYSCLVQGYNNVGVLALRIASAMPPRVARADGVSPCDPHTIKSLLLKVKK